MKHDSLSNTEWSRLTDIHKLLLPFKEQTDNLQTDILSLSCVIPSLLELSLHLKDPSLPKQLSQQLNKSLSERFGVFLNPSAHNFDPLPAAACFLDPAVSTFMMRDDTVQFLEAAKAFIKFKVGDYNTHINSL